MGRSGRSPYPPARSIRRPASDRRAAAGQSSRVPTATSGSAPVLKFLTTQGTIDRITPEGVVTTFPLPAGGGNVVELAAGPAGVWFTDPSANRVGEVNFSGHVVEYGAPTPSNVLEVNGMGLVVGPDGDAYYLEQNQPSIIKVAPGGLMVSFTVPNSSALTELLAGSDGVYFQTQPNDNPSGSESSPLDRLAPDGTLTTVTDVVPENAGMTFGPDGNLWFTGFFSIGRVALAPAPVPEPGPTLVIGGFPGFQDTATSPIASVGEATSTDLALSSNSADVTVNSATIDWGDGSAATAGTIVAKPLYSDGFFGNPAEPFDESQVSGSHAYAKAGSYTVTITILGTGPGGAKMTASTVESVSAVDPSPSPQPTMNLEAGRSTAFQGPILAFLTPTPHDGSGSDFTATIDWGDKSPPTAGTVVGGQGPVSTFIPYPTEGPTNLFEVSGGHTYTMAGSYTLKVTLADSFGHVSTESSPIQVAPGRLAILPTSPIVVTADSSPGSSASGQDWIDLGTMADFVNGATAATDSVMIDWGDGSAPTAVYLNASSSGDGQPPSVTSFVVGGTHGYVKAGDYTIKITAADQQGDSTEATATARGVASETDGHPFELRERMGGLLFQYRSHRRPADLGSPVHDLALDLDRTGLRLHRDDQLGRRVGDDARDGGIGRGHSRHRTHPFDGRRVAGLWRSHLR